ncbi:Sodium- and chloride-dependent betaine transporter [Dirofilaria immitis]|nr:Sodium- and chloride-dependent betaine transporter [Dirofilaria immitis]
MTTIEHVSSITDLTEGFKMDQKVNDAPINYKKTKSISDSNHISKKKKSLSERDQWSGPFDFIMSMIAYAVGLGNVWRFPYLCFKNGGGSFILGCLCIIFSLGALPVFIIEITIGQYTQRGAMEVWNLCPLFKGVGIGNVVIAFMCIAYFCVISSWNDETCITGRENAAIISGITTNLSKHNLTTETSVEQYWERRVLMQSNSISTFGGIQWELLGIMTLTWIIVYFALWKGITRARKDYVMACFAFFGQANADFLALLLFWNIVIGLISSFVYFCALSPYFMLAVLLVRGLTLPGANIGIYFYLTPNATKLWDITVWKDAGTQVFYSYGVGFGTLIALGSHNKKLITASGFVVFSILGYMSVLVDKNIAQIVKPGPGLAFLAYPEVASNLPLKQVWSMLFFLMITILGLDSQICMLEGLYTALEDVFPHFLRKYKKISLAITCLFFFILGIPMAGSYWLTLFDAYGASGIALLFVVFFEITGLSWGFGAHKVRDALKEMIGIELWSCWIIIWKFITPSVVGILFFFCIYKYQPLKYPTGENFPIWAEMFGFFLSSCSMVVIPGYAIYNLCFLNLGGSTKERLRHGLQPPSDLETGLPPPLAFEQNDFDMEYIDCDCTK